MTQTLDDSHKEVEVTLPKGVQEDDVEVIALFLNKLAEPDKAMLPICLKQKAVKAVKKPDPKPEPKTEVKAEVKTPVKAEVTEAKESSNG